MPNANQIVLDRMIGHMVDLTRFESNILRKVLSHLKQLEIDMLSDLVTVDPTSPIQTEYQRKRFETLLQQVRATIDSAYNGSRRDLRSELRELRDLEIDFLGQTYNFVLQADVFSTAIAPELLKAVVDEQYIDGELMGGWLNKQKRSVKEAFTRNIRQGMLLGEPLNKLVARIRGRPTGKRTTYILNGKRKVYQEYKGGVMDAPLHQMRALVRTASQSVANDSRRLFYEENERYYKGYQAVTTLDFRTTMICINRTNAVWSLDGKPLKNTTEQFPGFPPWHWNCRSTVLPILKSLEELGLPKSIERDIPEGTKASLDGQVADDTNYGDWLRTRSVEEQRDKLGPTKYELWKSGKAKFSDMVDQFGRPLTVSELRKKYDL